MTYGRSTDPPGEDPSTVQRRIGSRLEDLPAPWLVEFEGVLADEVDRLATDRRLYQVLAGAHFEGPGWQRFSDALARYGLQVLRAWVRKGTVFQRCMDRGIRTPKRRPLDPDAANEIALMTVAEAIGAFQRSVLPQGVWDPDRGASLRTFFIGQCLLRFPGVYKAWLSDYKPLELVPLEVIDRERADGDPAHLAEVRVALTEAIQKNERMRVIARILALVEEGYNQTEVAAQLRMSVGAVESMLYRHRQGVRA